jgi:S-adenosylmethionine-dependent methyltransferase
LSGLVDEAATRDHGHVASFKAGEQPWIERLGSLRNVVRQEVIARQIGPYAGQGSTVLDVGCGQGTQALRLASSGCRVTGVDPSLELLGLCAHAAAVGGLEVDLIQGQIEDLEALCGGRTFDLVCCHGVMMYLDDRTSAIGSLAARMAVDGRISVTFRNGHALAMRPGLRGDWVAALSAFNSTTYVNELELPATADRIEEIEVMLLSAGLRIVTWYGVRVLTDAVSADASPPALEILDPLFDAEERAGATEPYKWMASQLHIVAERVP